MRRQGQFISHRTVLWSGSGAQNATCEINVVWAYISYLRRKLASLGADVKITASRGRGTCWRRRADNEPAGAREAGRRKP